MAAVARYKNIDSILVNAANVLTLGRLIRSCLPRISDEVILKTNDECAMIVRVSWISQDGATFRGKSPTNSQYREQQRPKIYRRNSQRHDFLGNGARSHIPHGPLWCRMGWKLNH